MCFISSQYCSLPLNNKMNSLVVVNICIVLLHVFILVNLTTAIGLGDSSCMYSGFFDSYNFRCHKDVVKIKKIPKECSAFVFDGVICTQDYKITFRWIPEDLEHLRSLVDFEDGTHNVYLFYGHRNFEDWIKFFYFGNVQTEAQRVHDFTTIYPVTGLILDRIENPISCEGGGDFYKNFTAYVTALKNENKNLEIGFYLSARTLIQSVNEVVNSTWFDFSKMNGILDFYVIEFTTFNNCSNEFSHGGITPLESSNPEVMSLNKFAAAFEKSTIAKEKVYFEFLISPVMKPEKLPLVELCQISYNSYCEYRDVFEPLMCVDNQEILYNKGKFAKKYSKGFIGKDIDLVDRDNKCDCDNKYVTFYMLLDGYNNVKDPLTCKAFN